MTVKFDASSDASLPWIIVADTGLVYEPQDADRVFDTFVGAHPRNKYEDTDVVLPDCGKISLQHRIDMPVMNSWVCFKKLKTLSRFRQIPLSIYALYTSEADKPKARTLEANWFFSKPYNIAYLKSFLFKIMRSLDSPKQTYEWN